jgi:hypothetical protein
MEAGGDPFKVRFFVIDDPLGQNMRFLSSAPAQGRTKNADLCCRTKTRLQTTGIRRAADGETNRGILAHPPAR